MLIGKITQIHLYFIRSAISAAVEFEKVGHEAGMEISGVSPQPDLASLRASGWGSFEDTGFIGLIGPILFKTVDGDLVFGFVAQQKHSNSDGNVHGGMLAAFADRAIGAAAREVRSDASIATIDFGMHFVAPVRIGQFVQAECEPVRITRSLAFMRCTLKVDDMIVATADGILKLSPKPPA